MSVLAQLKRLCECFFVFSFFLLASFEQTWQTCKPDFGVFWLFCKPDSLLHTQIAAQHATNVALGTYESRDHLRCDRNEVLGYTKTTQNMAKQALLRFFNVTIPKKSRMSPPCHKALCKKTSMLHCYISKNISCKASSFNYSG